MKTLLLQLPKNLDKRYDYDQVAQPLGLACISSYMKSRGKDVVLFDAHANRLDREQILTTDWTGWQVKVKVLFWLNF